MPTLAVLTMAYNEKHKLPRWVDYYTRQVGAPNCYIIDHGSDDGSVDKVGACQVIRLPRSAHDNQRRTDAVNNFANGILKYYDYVLYTDCDEMIVADPLQYDGLGDYCNKARPDYTYSIGVDVLHKIDQEEPLRPDELVTHQRSYVHYSAAMCKPNLSGLPVRWIKGFHSTEYPPKFGALYNFHLRYADLGEALDRLDLTRSISWAQSNEGGHQKLPDATFEKMMRDWGRLPIQEVEDWSPETGGMTPYLRDFVQTAKMDEKSNLYNVDVLTFGKELFRIPARFRGIF